MDNSLDSIHVLIVDDSMIVRKAIAKAVVQSGVDPSRIREAGNGQEALDSLNVAPADVVFLDINMPIMNGEEFMVALDEAKRAHDQYIVVVSTEVNAKRLMRMAKMGARGRLKKPFEPERLREMMIEAAAEKADAQSQAGPIKPPVDVDELAGALASALETMCFVIADPVEDLDPQTLEHHASISIGEEESVWRLSLSASSDLLIEIASGLMGTDPSEMDTETIVPATLLELANVFSGELITLLGGEDIPYRPGIPEPESEAAPAEGATLRIGFDAMGDGLVVTLDTKALSGAVSK